METLYPYTPIRLRRYVNNWNGVKTVIIYLCRYVENKHTRRKWFWHVRKPGLAIPRYAKPVIRFSNNGELPNASKKR